MKQVTVPKIKNGKIETRILKPMPGPNATALISSEVSVPQKGQESKDCENSKRNK
jgi:hypothetical protein